MIVVKKWSVIAILSVSQFVMVLDSTVMNVSISNVVSDLHTSVNAMQAAITFYTLTMAALMLIGAKIAGKIGLLKAFAVGSVIYGLGSLITGVSQNVWQLILGWSFIEGIGAVLVIPAIAALVAVHYKGKDRITAYAIIGGISGVAAAAGRLIEGVATNYLSWRYVFIEETVIMLVVLILSRTFNKTTVTNTESVDIPSSILSASGMAILVFGMLQSKTWGWVEPITKPVLYGREIAPLGISIVAYMILAGIILLWFFYDRQKNLEFARKNPLVHVSMLKSPQLRSGLGVLTAQYLITGAIFFVGPIYLQMVQGLDSMKTGIKILPLSLALIIFSIAGSRLVRWLSPKAIVRSGQLLLIFGAVFFLAAVNANFTGWTFALSMFALGAGLGMLASQVGNVTMSTVSEEKSNEVGGLQGALQNFGSSLGTALIGSVLIAILTTGFLNSVAKSSLPPSTITTIQTNTKTTEIVPVDQVANLAESEGASPTEAQQIASLYKSSQLNALKEALFFMIVLSLFTLPLSRNMPNKALR